MLLEPFFFSSGEKETSIYTIISLIALGLNSHPRSFLSFASSWCALQAHCLNQLKQGCGLVLLHKRCTIIRIHRQQ